MMRGGAMRNRAPRFFGGFVLWLTFLAHAECAENFEHESHEFREKVFWGASRRMRGMRGNF